PAIRSCSSFLSAYRVEAQITLPILNRRVPLPKVTVTFHVTFIFAVFLGKAQMLPCYLYSGRVSWLRIPPSVYPFPRQLGPNRSKPRRSMQPLPPHTPWLILNPHWPAKSFRCTTSTRHFRAGKHRRQRHSW